MSDKAYDVPSQNGRSAPGSTSPEYEEMYEAVE
jgi:hypothetical protein